MELDFGNLAPSDDVEGYIVGHHEGDTNYFREFVKDFLQNPTNISFLNDEDLLDVIKEAFIKRAMEAFVYDLEHDLKQVTILEEK